MIVINKDILILLFNLYIIYNLHNKPECICYVRNFFHFLFIKINTCQCYITEYLKNNDTIVDDELSENDNNKDRVNTTVDILKYEEKYLKEIRLLNKDFIFNEREEIERVNMYTTTYENINNNLLEQIKTIKNKIDKYKLYITNYELKKEDYCLFDNCRNKTEDDNNNCELNSNNHNYNEDNNSDDNYSDDDNNKMTEEEKIEFIQKENEILAKEYNELLLQYDDKSKIRDKALSISKKYIIDKQLDRLNNCYIIEKTPLGNVLMIYNKVKNSFSYYSDNTIPYRYLETVARKYVKTFNCRPIYIDMEEELKLAEERWEKERKEKEETDKVKNREEHKNVNNTTDKKKNVFAKFKSYNKDTSSTAKSMAAPPKNSIPSGRLTKEQENEKILLKEKSNCYTYEGKFANFNFLKKVDRKIVDKKYGLTFADFKKIQKK